MTVADSRNIFFKKCEFYDNQEHHLVNAYRTTSLSFADCEFRNNRGPGMFNVEDGVVSVKRSTFSGNTTEEVIENSTNVSFDDCAFK